LEALVNVGTSLPALSLEATPTFVVSTALATRDFQNVHHDRDAAQAGGAADVFLNILTTTGLVQRFVTDWAGPSARVGKVSIRLGAPCTAYETLTFSGSVTSVEGQTVTVAVVGKVSRGNHVTGTVVVEMPA
jgi:acyl dehydratase